jgi:hypothetical protein
VVDAVLPDPVSAAWKHLSSHLLEELLADAGRSGLWTSTLEWLRPLPEQSAWESLGTSLLHVVGEFGYMTLAGCWGVASHSGN